MSGKRAGGDCHAGGGWSFWRIPPGVKRLSPIVTITCGRRLLGLPTRSSQSIPARGSGPTRQRPCWLLRRDICASRRSAEHGHGPICLGRAARTHAPVRSAWGRRGQPSPAACLRKAFGWWRSTPRAFGSGVRTRPAFLPIRAIPRPGFDADRCSTALTGF